MTGLDGACALVTGASSGIGRAVAELFSARGARLLLTGRDPERLDDVASLYRSSTRRCDLAMPGAAEELAGWATEEGPPQVLVHCAGVGLARPAGAAGTEVSTVLATNLEATVRLVEAFSPLVRRTGHAHVALVSSIAGVLGAPGESVYSASKGGLHAYGRSLRMELAPDGVLVSTVVPGVVDTPFFERRGAAYQRRFPRPVPPARVAAAVALAVEHHRSELFVPAWLRVPAVLAQMAPSTYHRLSRWGA